MADRKHYYRILHVQRDAPAEVIRSSYRTLMQKLRMHPDLGGDHERAALINEAFAVLSNPELRSSYDARYGPERDSPEPGASDGPADDDSAAAANASSDEESSEEPHPVDFDLHCLFCSIRCRPIQLREPDDMCRRCGAPLYPAEQRRFEAASQRAMERIPRQTSAALSLRSDQAFRHSGLVQDISLNGLQLHTVAELQPGQVILIRTDLLDAVARVVDSQPMAGDRSGEWRVGLTFLTMRLHQSRGSFVSVDA
jgi:curved DNA-binding protein CbpA